MPGVMFQGTGSNVGKSMLVAGICRAAKHRGLRVAPFKPQNMSNNAAVTANGGEIGRAQALQALACGLPAHTDMNPVLLKPESDRGAQVVVQGRRLTTCKAADYAALKPTLLPRVLESYHRIEQAHDLVLVEGAGSPAEVNLRIGDIANMGFAEAARIPVVLIGDIDRGGVIAQLVGTREVLNPDDADLVKGFVINKFRGDPALFDDGYGLIEATTGWPGFGVLPWFERAGALPAEDGLDLRRRAPNESGRLNVACLALPRIANFDDLDPISAEPDVRLFMVEAGDALPGDSDLVIIPGSKSTRSDLAFLKEQGWDIDIRAHHRRGGHVLGLCGGFQMLGHSVSDPGGLEGPPGVTEGIGLLSVETVLGSDKTTKLVTAQHCASGTDVTGYEIHLGRSTGPDTERPFARINGRPEGAVSADGQVIGTYLHGLFEADKFRTEFLTSLGAAPSDTSHAALVDDTLNALAEHVEQHLNLDAILTLGND